MWRSADPRYLNQSNQSAERHITVGATYRILCCRQHKMRYVRTYGSVGALGGNTQGHLALLQLSGGSIAESDAPRTGEYVS